LRPVTTFVVRPINPRPPQRAGEALPVSLDQTILDHTGHDDKGPHPCGKAEVLPDGRLRISILHTNAGRQAIGMLEDDLLEVVLWSGSVRLR
jgi:hypothetical protein